MAEYYCTPMCRFNSLSCFHVISPSAVISSRYGLSSDMRYVLELSEKASDNFILMFEYSFQKFVYLEAFS